MCKNLIVLVLSIFLLFSCSKKNEIIVSDPTEEEVALELYAEAVKALQEGDSFYAAKKFREVESLMSQYK